MLARIDGIQKSLKLRHLEFPQNLEFSLYKELEVILSKEELIWF